MIHICNIIPDLRYSVFILRLYVLLYHGDNYLKELVYVSSGFADNSPWESRETCCNFSADIRVAIYPITNFRSYIDESLIGEIRRGMYLVDITAIAYPLWNLRSL